MKFDKKTVNIVQIEPATKYSGARYQCLKCRHIASYTTMLKHEDGQLCTTRQAQESANLAGLKQLTIDKEIEAVRRSGVEFERKPARYIYFVPEWVAHAIKAYKKQGKYAGMSLDEFLSKCKPQ